MGPYVITELCVTHWHYLHEMQVYLLSTSCSKPCKTHLVKMAHTPLSSNTDVGGTWDTSPPSASPWCPYNSDLISTLWHDNRTQGNPGLFFVSTPLRSSAAQALKFHPERPEHAPIQHFYKQDPQSPALSPALSRSYEQVPWNLPLLEMATVGIWPWGPFSKSLMQHRPNLSACA